MSQIHPRLKFLIALSNLLTEEVAITYRGINKFGIDQKEPFISLIEDTKVRDPLLAGDFKTGRSESVVFVVQGFSEKNRDNPTDPTYAMLYAVESAIIESLKPKSHFSSRAEWLEACGVDSVEVGQGIVWGPTENISDTGFFQLPIRVKINTTR